MGRPELKVKYKNIEVGIGEINPSIDFKTNIIKPNLK